MGRALALLVCALTAPCAGLPSVNVDGWSKHKLRNLCASCAAHSWWVQLGPNLYSPALGAMDAHSLERVDGEEVPSSTRDFAIYRGYPLPPPLRDYLVGSHADAFLLHKDGLWPETEAFCKTAGDRPGSLCQDLAPLVSGLQVSVPLEQLQAKSVRPRSLERGDAALELDHRVTAESFLKELGDFTDHHAQRSVLSALMTPSGVHQARDYLRGRLEALGMETRLQKFKVPRRDFEQADLEKDVTAYNVIGCWPGASADESMMLAAHYDTMPEPSITGAASDMERSDGSPGAMDNGSGVASVLQALESARGLKEKIGPSVYASFFSSEEQAAIRRDVCSMGWPADGPCAQTRRASLPLSHALRAPCRASTAPRPSRRRSSSATVSRARS